MEFAGGQLALQVRRALTARQPPVVDADTHATDTSRLEGEVRDRYFAQEGYYHGRPISAEDIAAEMNMAQVDVALTWQNPAATSYPGDPDGNAEALLTANRYILESALRYPERFVPAGWVDPRALGLSNALHLVNTLVRRFGFAVVKMNPAQNRFQMDSEECFRVVDRIVELGAVPAFHYGADSPYTPASGLRRIAERLEGHPILAVHMGGGGAGYVEAEQQYHESRELGLRLPNIRYVFSAKRDTHIENALIEYQLAGEPFRRNLFCASDAPYGRMTWNFGGFRAMFRSLIDGSRHTDSRVRRNPGLFTEESAKDYMGGNAARFLLEAYDRLLATHGHAAVCS